MKHRILIFIALMVFVPNAYAEKYDVSLPAGNNFEIAKFRLWLPHGEPTIQALLIIVPGYNGDGRNEAGDSLWQVFAQKHRLAIMACYFKDYENPEVWYRQASKGSGQALLDGIHKFALKTGKPALDNMPLILWGTSAGGQFNYEFACWRPHKVLSFVVNKGGYYHTCIASKATQNTPGLFFFAEHDLYYRKNIIKGIFSVNRRLGALWTLIEEKNIGHGVGASKKLSISYFNSIIPMRLSATDRLTEVKDHDFYLGDWETKQTNVCTKHSRQNHLTVWIPDSVFAEVWEELYR